MNKKNKVTLKDYYFSDWLLYQFENNTLIGNVIRLIVVIPISAITAYITIKYFAN